MGTLTAKQLETILGQVRKDNPEDYRLLDVVSLAEKMAQSINESATDLDSELCKEFRFISDHISKMKDDISRLQTASLNCDKIPNAEKELSDVVKSTEDATNKIMESAELIMSTEPDQVEKFQQVVNDSMIDIFEACSFQDLTGQRVSRVMETLEFIDRRLVLMNETIGDLGGKDELFEEEICQKKRKEDLMLHGPQNEGEGESQDDIDALFD